MPLLSPAQQAVLRNEVHTPSVTNEQTVDVYRNLAVDGTQKTGRPVLFQSAMAVRIRPAGQATSMMRLLQQVLPLNAARVSHLGKADIDEDVQQGDEWRDGATKYKLTGVGKWQNAIYAALEEVREQK